MGGLNISASIIIYFIMYLYLNIIILFTFASFVFNYNSIRSLLGTNNYV